MESKGKWRRSIWKAKTEVVQSLQHPLEEAQYYLEIAIYDDGKNWMGRGLTRKTKTEALLHLRLKFFDWLTFKGKKNVKAFCRKNLYYLIVYGFCVFDSIKGAPLNSITKSLRNLRINLAIINGQVRVRPHKLKGYKVSRYYSVFFLNTTVVT